MYTPDEKPMSAKREFLDQLYYPKSHLRLHTLLSVNNHFNKQFSTQAWTNYVYGYFGKELPFAMQYDRMEIIRNSLHHSKLGAPKLKHQIEALQAMGLHRQTISEMLTVSVSNIAYHLAKDDVYKPFENMYFRNIQMEEYPWHTPSRSTD